MSKVSWVLLILGILCCCGAALAQSPAHPAAPDLDTLHQAIFAPSSDPQPKIVLCSPPTNDVCPYKQCECLRYTCSRCGIKSFTCNEATGQSSCVCKTC
ncbi:MAG TPA: hypothetical protein VIJ02_09625 [Thermoanaerobaculia bacterium]